MSFFGNTRRNNNKSRGGGRGGGGRGGGGGSGGGGPLMTDHLQDLELELELLKRKRQLIQRQQNQMLFNRGPAVDNTSYNQPSQSYNDRFNEPQHLNFSHMYNEAPRDDRTLGLKRRADPDWSNAPGDRFDKPMGGNKRPRQSGPFNRFTDQNNTQTFQRPRPNQPQPLMAQPRPLLNFQSQPVRRAPQPNMAAKQNQGPKPLTHHPNFKRFKQPGPGPRPGFSPNKTNTPFHKTTPFNSTSPNVKRDKKAPVLSADQEPSAKTNGRLELALGMIVKEIKQTYASKPECAGIFSSMPLARVMKQGIRERVRSVMTGKVVGLVPDIVAEYRQKYPLETDKDIVDLALVEKQKTDTKIELAIKLFEEGDPEEFFKKNMSKILVAKFGEMMQKLEKLANNDNNLTTAAILANLPVIKKAPEEGEKTEKDAEGAATATEEVPEKTADETETSETSVDFAAKENEYVKWISIFLERKLPVLMARNKNAIFRVFDVDHMFRNTKAAIILNTNKKAQAINRKEGFANGSAQAKDDTEMPRSGLPYFAKVLANPSIPKRKLMQEFLNTFNPKTIKRHKKNFNLLFIGFDNKEDYDKILAANQTVIGNATLTIAGNVVKAPTIEIDDVLTPQLDDQINDLLSSIRKADEESQDDGDTSNTTAEVDLTADTSEIVDGKVKEDNSKTEESKDKETEAANASEKVEDANGTENSEATNTEKTEADDWNTGDDKDEECQVIEPNGKEVVTIEDDEVAPLKSDEVKQGAMTATPAKGKAPATPSSIRTRRSSRLVQN